MVDKDKIDRDESDGNETNLSNSSMSKKSTRAGYPTCKGAKKRDNNTNSGGGNTKKSVKAVKRSNYLTPNTKKTFNHLRHAFIQASILQHFDLGLHIRIKIDMSDFGIGKVLNQLILDDLG